MESGNYNRGTGNAAGGGRGRGRGGRGGNYHQRQGPRGGGGGGRGGRGGSRGGGQSQSGGGQQWDNRTVFGAYRPQQQQTTADHDQGVGVYGRGGYDGGSGGNCGGGGGVWGGRPSWSQPQPEQDIESLEISEQKPPLALSESTEDRILPIKRPDRGGTHGMRSVSLFANHFPVKFNPEGTILHYDVDIKPHMSPGTQYAKKSMSNFDLRLILKKLFSDDPTRFPDQMTAYDGNKNIFSAVPLPAGQFPVRDMRNLSYTVTITLVNKHNYSKLEDYQKGNLVDVPRAILQGLDLVMMENPSGHRISVGRSFYSKEFREKDDLQFGIAAFRGFQQSLKPTSQGLVLCLDHTVLAFLKQLPVIAFLKEHVRGFQDVNDVWKLGRPVASALKGLKVNVTHRVTKQRLVIAGLSKQKTCDITFIREDPEKKNPPRVTALVEYFWQEYNKEILYKDIPCLDLGKGNWNNYVPMEFCKLAEGQIYPKDKLHGERGKLLKRISMPPAKERQNTICEMVRAKDGPCGKVVQNFEITVEKNMTRVLGRVLEPPALKLRTPSGSTKVIRVDRDSCQWKLLGNLVDGKQLKQWALIDFSLFDGQRSNSGFFIQKLKNRCRNMGVLVEDPVVCRFTGIDDLSSVSTIQELLESVVKEANTICEGRLQLFVCIMPEKNGGRKYLKWVSETRIGVMTQCCLASHAFKRDNDQYLANVALKINAKLGGSNVELAERFPGFEGDEHVMFIGADVNHPGAGNKTCPSIAAVVATINWPAANRYVARICPQDHRKEKILDFGATCLDLINTYARLNKVRPKKIVVFRDGVSEGQFDMVLNEELLDLKRAIYEDHYRPTITLIVAQKRHLTRMFVENERDGGRFGNVPPGTVIDTTIVHPIDFDFYLYSHFGLIGTSKPTHYYVLWDEHNFTSDQMQKFVYHLCFTSARCNKPVSLVPPVHYADLVAYRGRSYQEVAMELQPPAGLASSSPFSSSAGTSSAALLNERFYKVHPDLKNEMFFV